MNKIKKILGNKYVRIGLIALGIVLLGISIYLLVGNKKEDKKIASSKEEKTFAHTEENITKEEEYEGLKFTNISLITDKGYTTFTATVTNTTDRDITVEDVAILLKDKNDKTIIKLRGNITDGLKAGESKVITSVAKGQFKNAVSKAITAYED